jgi:hypothetical protein
MNSTVNKPWLAQTRRLFVHFLFGFFPAMIWRLGERGAGAAEKSLIHRARIEVPAPYLEVVGPPPLRFMAPAFIAIPDPNERKPRASSAEAASPPDAPVAPLAGGVSASKVAPAVDKGARPSESNEPAIIKDELKPQVRPEQFLPFFQLPGPGSLPITPDAQPPLPPSTATYRQE